MCVSVCVCVLLEVLDWCKRPVSTRLHNVLDAENFKCCHRHVHFIHSTVKVILKSGATETAEALHSVHTL